MTAAIAPSHHRQRLVRRFHVCFLLETCVQLACCAVGRRGVPLAGVAMAAPDAVQALRGRLGGARLLLEPQVGTGAHVALSKIQCRSVLSMLGSSTLSSDDRSALVPLVMSVAFTDADANLLLEAFANDGDGTGGSRRKSQDFTAFVNYFDEARWKRLLDDSTLGEKEVLVIQLLRSLGLRLPSELTFKLMASFLLLISETWESASQRTLPDKKALLARTKADWRVGARTVAAPPVWFAKLPESPTDVLAKHRDLFHFHLRRGRDPSPTAGGHDPLAYGRQQFQVSSV